MQRHAIVVKLTRNLCIKYCDDLVGYLLALRFISVGAQVSISWCTSFYQLAECLRDLETCKQPIRFLDSYMLYSKKRNTLIIILCLLCLKQDV